VPTSPRSTAVPQVNAITPVASTPRAEGPMPAARRTRPARARIVIPARQSRRTVLARGLRLRCIGTRRCAARVAARGTRWHRFAAPGTRLRLSGAQRRTLRRRHALTLRLRVGDDRSTRRTVRLTRR
jgi:hypothetical protein